MPTYASRELRELEVERRRSDPAPPEQEQEQERPAGAEINSGDHAALLRRLHPEQRHEMAARLSGSIGNAQLQRLLRDAAPQQAQERAGGGLTDMIRMALSAMSGVKVSDSVGRGGKNAAQDVALVQARLRLLGFLGGPEAAEPGRDGTVAEASIQQTIGAIERYQTIVLRFRRADGRVDPGGKTESALNAFRRPKEQSGESANRSSSPDSTPDAPDAAREAGPAEEGDQASTAPAEETTEEELKKPLSVTAVEQTIASLNNPVLDGVHREVLEVSGEERTTGHGSGKSAKKKREQSIAERQALVQKIEELRIKIASLDARVLGVDAPTLKAIKAYLYKQLAIAAPYYAQGVNANILYKKGGLKASGRTCNVTSIAMCLEALGKEPKDFPPERKPIVQDISVHFQSVLGKEATDVERLRMPDFLQLVAVYVFLEDGAATFADTDPEKFNEEVEKAREKAAKSITQEKNFQKFTELFKVRVESKSPDRAVTAVLEEFGSVLRAAASKKRQKQLGAKDQEDAERILREQRIAKWTGKKGELARKLLAAAEATESDAAMEQVLSVEAYQHAVLEEVEKTLGQGKQVIAHMWNHFTRLQAIDDRAITLDDPGSLQRKDVRLSWAEARQLGTLSRWAELERG